MLFTLLLFAASVVLAELLRPKPNQEGQRPAGLGDFQFPTATEDRHIPIAFGTVKIAGPNVVWYGDLSQDAITQTQRTGFFSKVTTITGFRYRLGVQFALCDGSNGVTLTKVEIGDKEAWTGTLNTDGSRFDIDEADFLGGDTYGAGGIQASADFYTGSTTQAVNAYLDDADRQRITTATTPTAPAYRGTCYVVARELTQAAATASDRGAYLGNSTQIKKWAFHVQSFPALFSGQTSGDNVINTNDCNPMNVAYDVLTSDKYGLGASSADIDLVAFAAASTTLKTEGNGFSMLIDRPMRAREILNEIQRQINGFIFQDRTSGKWTVKLARDDYTIGTVPQITDADATLVRMLEFDRSAWEDTTNVVQVQYTKRDDNYKQSNAIAQDTANAIMQGGGTIGTAKRVAAQIRYPGVMNSTTAANLAWRDLRTQSYPLARGRLVVNREFFDSNLGDVVALTHSGLGIPQMAIRIMRIRPSTLQQNEIEISFVQDVFSFAAASFGDPGSSKWTDPSVNLVAFPSTQQLAIEAPRALLTRDPDYSGNDEAAKVLCAARRQGGEVAFQIGQRNHPTLPAGAYTATGDVVQFMLIGQLTSNLAQGTAVPTSAITITATPDTQANLEAAFDDNETLANIGSNLAHLILVGDEFMLVSSASNNASNVDLENVYRGVLDTVQQTHNSGTNVYLVAVGAGLTDATFDHDYLVDIELRMKSSAATFSGSVTAINLDLNKRAIRPYPPSAPLYNNTSTRYGTPDVEGDGSGSNGLGFDVEWLRRRYNATDEVQELLADQTVDASTEYRVRVFVDPNGSNDEAFTGTWATGTGPIFVNRLALWDFAAAGTEIRVQIETRHDINSETDLTSIVPLTHDVTPTSARDSDFYLGSVAANVATNSYTAAATGTFVVNIGAAFSTANVEYRLNGGSWTTVIAATGTTGNIAGVTATDTIELRFTVNESPDPQYVEIQNPSATVVAYGVFSA